MVLSCDTGKLPCCAHTTWTDRACSASKRACQHATPRDLKLRFRLTHYFPFPDHHRRFFLSPILQRHTLYLKPNRENWHTAVDLRNLNRLAGILNQQNFSSAHSPFAYAVLMRVRLVSFIPRRTASMSVLLM